MRKVVDLSRIQVVTESTVLDGAGDAREDQSENPQANPSSLPA